jgi:hypothetical protein
VLFFLQNYSFHFKILFLHSFISLMNSYFNFIFSNFLFPFSIYLFLLLIILILNLIHLIFLPHLFSKISLSNLNYIFLFLISIILLIIKSHYFISYLILSTINSFIYRSLLSHLFSLLIYHIYLPSINIL